jgi:hypothetical protein
VGACGHSQAQLMENYFKSLCISAEQVLENWVITITINVG